MSDRNNRRASARQSRRALCEQNHPTYIPGRHSGPFHILPTQDPAAFEAYKASLMQDFAPTTEAEVLLVTTMAEARWLSERAQNLTNQAMDMNTGYIIDTKLFSHSLTQFDRYDCAYHKALNQLLKIQAQKRKAEIAGEAQRLKAEALRLNNRLEIPTTSTLEDRAWQDSAFDADLSHLTLASVAGGPKYERLKARFINKYFANFAGSGLVKGFLA